MAKRKLKPVHPGEIRFEEFLKPMNLSQNRLALDIGVPPRRINEIVLAKRGITVEYSRRRKITKRWTGHAPPAHIERVEAMW